MSGQGSGGNVLAALCSFFIVGLGQLLQGRLGVAIIQFLLAYSCYGLGGFLSAFLLLMPLGAIFLLIGFIVHVWSILNAARFDPYPQDW